MAQVMSTYLANKILDHVFSGTIYTPPSAVYVGLFTGDPTIPANEIPTAGTAYQRQQATFSVAANAQKTNNADILYPMATAVWATNATPIDHIAIFDQQIGGNILYYGPTAQTKSIGNGDQYVIRSGQLTLGDQ